MRIAVIDMGTNTFHLLIVEGEKEGFKVLHREKAAVKIGENGINEGQITPIAVERALKALSRFQEIYEVHKVDTIFATATSAIRNARNGKDLVERIKQEIGISVRIISGIEEANYIYGGVKKALEIGSKPSLIMDIGGGSIEFIIATSEKALWMHSFEIGGLRLLEKFQKHDPITPGEITLLQEYLQGQLPILIEACRKFEPTTLIGSSGTFDTLSDIYRMKAGLEKNPQDTEYPLPMDAFRSITKELLEKNKEQRMNMPGMILLRVEMIVVATLLIQYVIDILSIRDIRVSAYALKEGVLLGILESLKKAPTV